MLNSWLPGIRPSARSCSGVIPLSRHRPSKYVRITSSANWSCPAGTAVCVVKTVLAATASSAVRKSGPCAISAADALQRSGTPHGPR